MQDERPSPLTPSQLTALAVLALGLSALGWWLGGKTSSKPEQTAPVTASVPINRREAEGGAPQRQKKEAPSLAYYENTAPDSRIKFIPSRSSGKNGKHSRTKKPIRIATDLTSNPQIGMASAAASPAPKTSSPSQNSKAAAAKKTTGRKTAKKHGASNHQPNASPKQTLSSSGLAYPPAAIAAKIGLSSAWRSYSGSLAYIFDSANNQTAGMRCPISADLWVCSSAAAQVQGTDSDFQPFLSLEKLHLTLLSAKTQSPPALASAPPEKNDYLATAGPASNPQAHASAKVTGTLYGGMFSLICPINTSFGASPLVNDRGELTGLAVGTIPAYRGHNHYLGLDSSLLYAWSRHDKEAGQQKLYDLNFQVCDQLERALNRLDRKKAERLAKKDEHSVLPGQALGGFVLGANSAEICAVLGEGSETSQDLLGFDLGAGDPMFKYVAYPEKGLAFNYYDDRLVAIETTSPVYTTPKGLKVGDRPDQGSHELTRRKCTGYTDHEHSLTAAQGLEIELNAAGAIELMRVTI